MAALTGNQKRILQNGYRWDVTMYSEEDIADMREFVAQGYFVGSWKGGWSMTYVGRQFTIAMVKADAEWRTALLAETIMGLMNVSQPGTIKYSQNNREFAETLLGLCSVEYTVEPQHDEETGEFLGDWWELKKKVVA